MLHLVVHPVPVAFTAQQSSICSHSKEITIILWNRLTKEMEIRPESKGVPCAELYQAYCDSRRSSREISKEAFGKLICKVKFVECWHNQNSKQ